jgi:hypothetical protein
MDTGAAQTIPDPAEDLLDGMFEVEDGKSKDGKGTESQLRKYLTIDERFKDLAPEEGLARTIQSREGVFVSNIEKINNQNAKLLKDSQFLEELTTNPELRRAFIAKMEPELSLDVDTQVQNILRKEFPDFEPVDEDKSNMQSKTAKYIRRQNRLYNELENSSSNKSVDEILTEIDNRKKEKSEAFNASVLKIKEREGYDDPTMADFLGFAKKFNLDAIHKVYKFKLAKSATGKVGSKSSSSGIVSQDANLKKLDTMFGKKKSGRDIRKKE